MNAFSTAGGYASEWPVGLLLDEVWLRTRRTLVEALEGAQFWPKATDYFAFLASQRRAGQALRDEALLAALPRNDRAWLMSPATFGASNNRFKMQTPLALAFGYSLGDGLQRLYGGASDKAISEACGLFNFGISVFDLLQDTQPELVPGFNSCFDHDVLRRLNSDPASHSALRETASSCEEPEIRLLLQIIAAVYERLNALAVDSPEGAFETLTSRLAAAYTAEMKSSSCELQTATGQIEISREKSTLPFLIIDSICSLRSGGDDRRAVRDALTTDIGIAFWLTDDLVDVIGDVRSGALNSLLVRAVGLEPADIGSKLTRLIRGHEIENTVSAILDSLLRVRTRVREYNGDSNDGFDHLVASYIRTWIE